MKAKLQIMGVFAAIAGIITMILANPTTSNQIIVAQIMSSWFGFLLGINSIIVVAQYKGW